MRAFLLALSLLPIFACGSSTPPGAPPSAVPGSKHAFDLESLAPADALIVVSTANWKTIRALAAKNAWLRLFGDETAWDLHHALAWGEQWDGYSDADPIKALGEIEGSAVWFMSMDANRNHGSMGFVVEPKAGDRDMDEFWRWFHESHLTSREFSTTTIEGAEVKLYTSREGLALFQTDRLQGLTFANPPERALEIVGGILQRANGDRSQSITSNERFQACKKQRTPGAIVSAYADVGQAWESYSSQTSSDFLKVPNAFEVDRFEWVGADLVLGQGEYWKLEVRAPIPEDSIYDQVLSHLGKLPLDLLDHLPAETFAAGLWRADLGAGVETLQAEFNERFPPIGLAFASGLNDFQKDTGLQLNDDVFAHLQGGGLLAAVPIPWRMPDFRRMSQNPLMGFAMEASMISIVPLQNSDAMQASMTQLAKPRRGKALPAVPMAKHVIYPFIESGEEVSPNYTIADRKLFFGLHMASMMRALKRLDGNEHKNRDSVKRLAAALRRQSDASLAIALDNAWLASLITNVARSVGSSSRGVWSKVRWPANVTILKALKGQTTASLRYESNMLSVSLEAR